MIQQISCSLSENREPALNTAPGKEKEDGEAGRDREGEEEGKRDRAAEATSNGFTIFPSCNTPLNNIFKCNRKLKKNVNRKWSENNIAQMKEEYTEIKKKKVSFL